jgi:DNA (cytosine-5)-methyltransferase 1
MAVKNLIEHVMNGPKSPVFWLKPLPQDDSEALDWLLPLLDLDSRDLKSVSQENFRRAWFSIAFLYMGLHPDSALDHGVTVAQDHESDSLILQRERRLLSPYYERSGWPVVLAPIAREAWRRYRADELGDDEFYCSEA